MSSVLAENIAGEHEDVGQPMSGCPWRAAIKPIGGTTMKPGVAVDIDAPQFIMLSVLVLERP